MGYIGTPVQQALTKATSQYFNGTGSQTVFTLNRAVNVPEDLEVFVNNIQQEPGVGKSYTATGTTLTFDAAPSSGTGNIYVIYRGSAEVTRRLEHDPNAALAATTGTFSGNVDVTGAISSNKGSAGTLATFTDGVNSNFVIETASLITTVGNTAGSTALAFKSSNTERLRIDSSGNLLVGKTTLDYEGTAGLILRGDGLINATRSGGNVTDFNRLSTDGEVVRVSKDGTTVGSIGTNSGYLYIGSLVGNDAYVWMGADAIAPATSSGGNRDNAISLGTSANRFKDLHLSGGVVFGATGGAVTGKTLDDYEEGVWTPVLSGATTTTYTSQIGRYTKIGELVYLFFDIDINSVGDGAATTVVGLPFAPYNNDALGVSYWAGLALSPYFVSFQIGGGPQALAVGTTAAGSTIYNGMPIFQNGSRIIASGCYRTPS
jgi:hypothetical protein